MWRKYRLGSIIFVLLFVSLVFKFYGNSYATTGINSELSFEGKIANTSSGVNLTNGTYNMEFKIYTGCTNNTGTGCTTAWTEDYLDTGTNTGGITFNGGTFQVNLGSICAFSGGSCETYTNTAINWNTYPLYLSVQVGNNAACTVSTGFASNCSGDGVMSPYILLTSTPYSLNSNELGGLTASQFGQTASTNTWSQQNIFQSTTNAAGIFQIQNSVGATIESVGTSASSANTNLLSYSQFDSGSFTSDISGWQAVSPGTIAQNTTPADAFKGINSLALTTTSSNGGAQTNAFTQTVVAGTYHVTFYVMPSTAMNASALVITPSSGSTCSPASEVLSITGFRQVSCTISPSSALTSLEISQNDGSARTIYIGQITLATSSLTAGQQSTNGTININALVASPLELESSSNSEDAFSVMNASGTYLLDVDTTDNSVSIGTNVGPGSALLAVGGSTGNFQVASTGTVTLAAGQSYTGAGALSLTSGGATNLTIDTGGAATLSVGGANATLINIASTNLTAATQTVDLGYSSTSGGTTIVNIGAGLAATAGTTTLESKGALAIGNASSSSITLQTAPGGSVTINSPTIHNGMTTFNNTLSVQDAVASQFSFQVLNSLGAPVMAAGSNNIVINGDFESSTSTTGWSSYGTGSSISQNTIQADSYSGNNSLAVAITGSANSGTQVTNFSQTFPAGTYVLNFEAMAGTGFSTLAASFGTGTCTLNSNTVSTSYADYYCTVTTTGITTAVDIYSTGTTTLTFYVDAVQIIPAINLLENPGFEIGTTGWSTYGTGSSITLNQNANFTYHGVSSLKIVTGTTGNAGAQVTSFISNLPAGTYTLSFEAGYAGTAFSTLNANFGTGTCTLSPAPATINVPTNGFVSYSCTVTTTGVTAAIYIDSTSATSSTFYLDSVQLSGGSVHSPYDIGAIQLRGIIDNPVTIETLSNSTSELQVANATGAMLLSVDSFDGVVFIGSRTTDATQVLIQPDSFSTFADTASCSTTIDQGALYYNTNSNNIRACINGSWQDLVSTQALALQLFGVVPNSGPTPGDLLGTTDTATANTGSPCQVVYYNSVATDVYVNACQAYSGGREITWAGGFIAAPTGASTFQNVCFNSSGSPALLGSSNTTSGSQSFNNLTTTNAITLGQPLLCLATIETGATSGSMAGGHIFDMRTFTTTTKAYAAMASATAGYLGSIVGPTTAGLDLVAPVTTTTTKVAGIVVASSAATSSGAPNVIIAIAGPQWIYAGTGLPVVGDFITPGGTLAGVPLVTSATGADAYDELGINLATADTGTCGTALYGTTDCQYDIFTNLAIQ
jgi:hypothetical protein